MWTCTTASGSFSKAVYFTCRWSEKSFKVSFYFIGIGDVKSSYKISCLKLKIFWNCKKWPKVLPKSPNLAVNVLVWNSWWILKVYNRNMLVCRKMWELPKLSFGCSELLLNKQSMPWSSRFDYRLEFSSYNSEKVIACWLLLVHAHFGRIAPEIFAEMLVLKISNYKLIFSLFW